MNELVVREYKGNTIRTLQVQDGPPTGYFHGQDMADACGKHDAFARQWVDTKTAREYLAVAAKQLTVDISTLVIRNNGGRNQGVWLHPKIARRFAQACSAELAWWVDELVEAKVANLPVETPEYHLFRLQEHFFNKLGECFSEITHTKAVVDEHDRRIGDLENDRKPAKKSQTECHVRDWIHKREGGYREVLLCTGEKIDLVIYDKMEIVEVKNACKWRDAVRQINDYAKLKPRFSKRIHLFGSVSANTKRDIIERCRWEGIRLTWAKQGDTKPVPEFHPLFA